MPTLSKKRLLFIVLMGMFVFVLNAMWGLSASRVAAKSTQQNYEECQSLFVEIQKLRNSRQSHQRPLSKTRDLSKTGDLRPQVITIARQIGIAEDDIQMENEPPVAIASTTLQKTSSTIQIAQIDTLNFVSFLAKIIEETGAEIEFIDLQQPVEAEPLDERWKASLRVSALHAK